ncbi:MAG TPA: flagellar biosynthesis protein FlhA [Chromatiales bacterium]|nr:flagellar biosynthesis protein FlhA [Thiotrichales bacterium]HIP68521.1 flagellar biosynthesis protein FlhA [Chromatiales bacterium]
MKNSNLIKTISEMTRNGLGAPLLVIIILAMMIVPMPAIGLDLLFTFNIALSLVVLMVTVYTLRPLEFSSFPTVLLVATMLRLALNIASTRVVLLEGHTGAAAAGNVIESFGEFVIGGNYAVGLVVFAILVIINFVVVTKGAGRVSEVTARFTLDAMPGKQMAIDADLNAGLIDQDQARKRREDVAQEADFYGSMDGASKFVRGDAVAGLLILFINLIGGLAIGIGQHDLSFSVAAENYTLLTIGDGLVAQIPSLLLSMATAIIVTRVSSSQDMGEQIIGQMFSDRRALVITAVVIGMLGLLPGMPNVVFLGFAGLAGGYAWWSSKQTKVEVIEAEEILEEDSLPEQKDLSWDDVRSVDIIGLEVGYRLIPLVDARQGGKLLDRIKGVRRKLSEELGFLVHAVHIRDNLDLPPGRYRITLLGVAEGEADIHPDRELAINPGNVFGELNGIATKDPAFGMDALWIEPAQRDHAQTLGYTVVDAGTVIATHLSKVLQEHAGDLLGHEEVQQLLDKLAQSNPKLVEDLVPKTLPLSMVVKVLQNLLTEGIPVRDMRTIAETLAEQAVNSQDADTLTAMVRVALRRMITRQINGLDDELPVITLDPELEQILLQSLQSGTEGGLGLEPGLAERLYQSLAESAQRQEVSGEAAVLLVSPQLRPWLARLIRHTVPTLKVLAYNEIAESKQLKVIANIGNETPVERLSPAA